MASPAPASHVEIVTERDVDSRQRRRRNRRIKPPEERSKLLDFTFHTPTAADILNLKVVGFSCLVAVAMMVVAFSIAAGLLRLV